jgi:hypothetical protein
MIGLYEGGGRVDFGIRASLLSPVARPVLPDEAIERVVRLPQTTLFASAFTMDFEQAYGAALASPSTAVPGRLLTLLAGLRDPGGAPAGSFPELGPEVLVVWDQDLRGKTNTPQLAIMIQCSDARRLRDEATEVARNALKLIEAVDATGAAAKPAITQAVHLGTPIVSVDLEAYARKSQFEFLRLLRHTEPSWAAFGNWCIFALSRDHIERILDARHGLIPTLTTVGDVQWMWRRKARRTALSIVQADLAADVLDGWLKDYEAGSPSLLDPTWWESASGVRRPDRQQLGIAAKVDQQPGLVVVAHVHAGTAAAGRLQPGDGIIGIDGRLLDLASPNDDFRKKWAESRGDPGPTLRVQRGDTIIDVVLPRPRPAPSVTAPRVTPADAVRELASLARTLQFASFASYASKDTRYSAGLSLRFAPANTP